MSSHRTPEDRRPNQAPIGRRGFLVGAGIVASAVALGMTRETSRTASPKDPEGRADPARVPGSTASKVHPYPMALADAPKVNPRQRFLRMFGGGNGIIYAVRADGALVWFRHSGWRTGAPSWVDRGRGRVIGTGFHAYRWVGASETGEIFALRGNGELLRYRYLLTDADTGAGAWADHGHPRQIATGWDRFARVFGGPGSVLWAVDSGGGLYRAAAAGNQVRMSAVGSGFDATNYLMADTDGQLYAVRANRLTWQRYTGSWLNPASAVTLTPPPWASLINIELFCAGDGVFYLIIPDSQHQPPVDDQLTWIRLTKPVTQWNGQPVQWKQAVVAIGPTVQRSAALQGYAITPSLPAGGQARFAISSTFASVKVSLVRCDAPGGLVSMSRPSTIRTEARRLPADFLASGCSWPESARLPIPAHWPSGVYALRLDGPHGLSQYLPFVVRPTQPRAQVAVILPTNTYEAYNSWGGHDAYTHSPAGIRNVARQRPADNLAVQPEGKPRAELYSDLLLLRWLNAQGIGYDLYTDPDLDADPAMLLEYRAVVLGSHAEYWTDRARQGLVDFQNNGGRLINTGGNALFERVHYDSTSDVIRYRLAHGARDYFLHARKPQSQLIGVDYDGGDLLTFAPYQVSNDHPMLAGTGLKVGDTFGHTGHNGAASGWETDRITGNQKGQAQPHQVIAVGTNTDPHQRHNVGAAMVMAPRPNGGFVFSASSISFNGALASDPAISKILHNVFTAALDPRPHPVA